MKKKILFNFLLSLLLAACSSAEDKKNSSDNPGLPTKLLFAAPKIKPLTPEMKNDYQKWVNLITTSQNTKNCQIITDATSQNTMPLYSGDLVQMNSKNELKGFFCPLRGEILSSFKATVLSNDRTRQIMKFHNDSQVTSEISVVDPSLRKKSHLSRLIMTYSASGSTVYNSTLKAQEYSSLSYTVLTETITGEQIMMTATGEVTGLQENLEIQMTGVLKTAEGQIEITTFQKNGQQQTYLNGHLLETADNLPAFPIPQVTIPSLTLLSI